MNRIALSSALPFAEASECYLRLRTLESLPLNSSARFLTPRTLKSYTALGRSLTLLFGQIPLREIHSGNLRCYQEARLIGAEPFIRKAYPHCEPASSPAGPQKVNQELSFLKMVMDRAGAWSKDLEENYEALRYDDPDVPRALSPDEQYCWLQVSSLKPRWAVVHHYSVLAFGTCMSTNELRMATLGNINLFHRLVTISSRGAKNRYRKRTIPIVDQNVLWSAEQLIERAKACGAADPQHYLFPLRIGIGPFYPTRHMTESGMKKLWDEVREASGIPWFRQYDCRHTAITRLAEAGTPIDVIMSMAGHVSERMRQHYTHISDGAKIKALQAVQNVMRPQDKTAWPIYRRA